MKKAFQEKHQIFKKKCVYPPYRVANCALWFLKLPHSEAMDQGIFNVNILGGSSSLLELLETIGNSNSTPIIRG
jgi:hypothetical protein